MAVAVVVAKCSSSRRSSTGSTGRGDSEVHRNRDGNLASGSVGSPGKALSSNASRSDGSIGSRKLRRKSWEAIRIWDCMGSSILFCRYRESRLLQLSEHPHETKTGKALTRADNRLSSPSHGSKPEERMDKYRQRLLTCRPRLCRTNSPAPHYLSPRHQ